MKVKTVNMTEGNPVFLLISFSVPMLIGNLFQQLYNLADAAIVGRFVGPNALAAVGSVGSVSFLFFSLCAGIGNGGGIITSQYFGAGEEDYVKKCIANCGYLLLASSALMGLVTFLFARTVLRFMDTLEQILEDALVYMYMQCIGIILVAAYNHVSSMLRALGDSITPLYFLILSALLNVGLDLLFVCVFHMGVFGAALATLISQLIAGIGCLAYTITRNPYFRLQKKHFKIEWQLIRKTIRLGIPLAMQYSMIAISSMGMQRVVNGFGPAVIAAYTAYGKVEQLLHQPYGTLSTALATYCGQNLGNKNIERIKLGFRKCMLIMTVFSLAMLVIMQFGSGWFVSLFVNDQEVIRYGTNAIRITSWFYVALGMINAVRGILNGIGDAAFALINGIVEVITRVTLPMILVTIPLFGVWGIWWAAGLTWVVSAFFCILRYLSWRKKNV